MNLDNFFSLLFIALFAATTGTAMNIESGSIDAAANSYAEMVMEASPDKNDNNNDNNEPAVLAMR